MSDTGNGPEDRDFGITAADDRADAAEAGDAAPRPRGRRAAEPKAADAFRTISEVSDLIGAPAHVLRFWETRFSQLKPVKRAGGRRYYRPSDVALLAGIRRLLHDEGMAIRGVQKILREKGVRAVALPLDEALEGFETPITAPAEVAAPAPVAVDPAAAPAPAADEAATPDLFAARAPAAKAPPAPAAAPAPAAPIPLDPSDDGPSTPADLTPGIGALLRRLQAPERAALLGRDGAALMRGYARLATLRARLGASPAASPPPSAGL